MGRIITLEGMTRILNRIWSGHVLARDVPYGNGPATLMDIYGYPAKEAKPVIIFWYGGSWSAGDKRYYEFLANYLQKLHAIVVMVGYPSYPDQTFPGFLDDTRDAIKEVGRIIGSYGGDPNRIYLMGHSSGAHLAAISALEDKTGSVVGCITLALPVTISQKYWGHIFGDSFKDGTYNPVSHISTGKQRFLLIHAEADKIVNPADSRQFDEALKQHGYPSDLVVVPGLSHALVLMTLMRPFSFFYPVGRRLKAFLRP